MSEIIINAERLPGGSFEAYKVRQKAAKKSIKDHKRNGVMRYDTKKEGTLNIAERAKKMSQKLTNGERN